MAKDLNYTLSLKDLFSKQMRGAVNETARLDSQMSKFDSKLRSIQNLMAGGIIGAGLVSFGKSVFNSLDNYQQFSVALRTMMYGDALASKALEGQLIQLAKTTPFELTEVQDATRKLMAYGVSGGEVAQTIRTLGDVSAGLGKESLPFIIRAFGQIKSKGHLAGQELNQLTEQGFNPLNVIAKKTGESYDTLLKRMEKGKITFSEVEQSFKDVTKEGGQFFGMMEEQSLTVGGRWSMIADTWEQIKVNIGKSQTGIIGGTISFFNKYLNTLNDGLIKQNLLLESIGKKGKKQSYLGGSEKTQADLEAITNMVFSSVSKGSVSEAAANKQIAFLASYGKIKNKQFKDEIKGIKDINMLQNYYAPQQKNRLAVIEEGIMQLKGVKDLMKSKGTATIAPVAPVDETGKLGSLGKSNLQSGVNLTAQRPQSLVININEMVHEIKVTANNLKDSTLKIKEEVSKIFLEMVNDANLATR